MENPKSINLGGINGLGKGNINTHDDSFIALQAMIEASSSKQDEDQKLSNAFLSIRFQMESYLSDDTGQFLVAGTFIEKLLQVIKVKKKDFATFVDYEEANLSALIKGRRKINPDLAIKMGRIFNMNPAIWLQIENKNELIHTIKKQSQSYDKYTLQALKLKAG
jgi:plasmid maintenance system antidote protein VapI